jgi:hypothetical protein
MNFGRWASLGEAPAFLTNIRQSWNGLSGKTLKLITDFHELKSKMFYNIGASLHINESFSKVDSKT